MPTLFILDGWRIVLYRVENEEPHFHVIKAEQEFRFRLADFRQMSTDEEIAPAGLARKVREWATRNEDALRKAWHDLQQDVQPDKTKFRR